MINDDHIDKIMNFSIEILVQCEKYIICSFVAPFPNNKKGVKYFHVLFSHGTSTLHKLLKPNLSTHFIIIGLNSAFSLKVNK